MLLKTLSSVFRYFCFWLLFFFLERLVFLVYNFGKLRAVPIGEVLKAFVYGLWMDASMAGYVCTIPLLIFIVVWFVPKISLSRHLLSVYSYVLIFLFSLLTVINFNIYREWGSKVNYRVFEFAFGSPREAIASTGSSPIVLSVLVFLGLAAIGMILFRILIDHVVYRKIKLPLKILVAFLLLALNFLAIRGGWQLAPMNESMAYYSAVPVLNYAAVNTEWGLATDIKNSKYNTKNPYRYFQQSAAQSVVKSYYDTPADTAPQILSQKKPNIVLIIMESFSGNVVPRLGGEPGISNSISNLMQEGIFFDNIYASGGRTDKGVVSVLSAFPAQAARSIMKENSKQAKIPSIPQALNAQGYRSSFYYGGESRFFNMKSYLLSHGFERIIEKDNFENKDMNSKWGAYDGVVYQKMGADLGTLKQPFLATMLSLTNHEPFELPGKPHFPGEDTENKFRSTAYYADSCLGAFLNHARKQAWYKNTLFVVVADHGHLLPRTDLEVYDPRRYRIPLLFFGAVIKPEFRGLKVEKIGSQTDIATTLLTQLGIGRSEFTWSKDLLNKSSKDFAFFNWDQGFGFVIPGKTITYDAIGNRVVYRSGEENQPRVEDEALTAGKSFMQEVYQQYIAY
jgi:phosphoglycerol transferase MdoB-like AlkP superfamily enzyme